MKLFCAYAFTGEDVDVLTKRMRLVVDTLNGNGHSAYCNRFDEVVDELKLKTILKVFSTKHLKTLKTATR